MGIRDTTTCTICGRIEQAARSCMGHQIKCSCCMDAMVSRHQLSFAKLHITKHKLPHVLATHVYQYLHGKATHRHAKRRIMFARFLQGKVETPSSLAALHHSLAAPIIEWHQSESGMFGHRANLFNRLTDLVIGPDTRQVRSWCPWCHGTGCD